MRIFLTLWYKDFRRGSLVSEVIDGGFDGFELSLDYPLCRSVKLSEIGPLKQLLSSGLEMGVHLPWREVYIASPIDEVRETSLNYVIRCLRELSSLDITYLVVHASTDQAVCSDNVDVCVSAGLKSITAIAEVASELGAPLYVETTRSYCCGGLEQVVNYLDYGASICLDIPHAVERYSRLYRRPMSLSEILREAPPRTLRAIGCVHLHGYTMSGYHVVDSHLEPQRTLLSEYLDVLRRRIIEPRYTVLESFYSLETGKQIQFNRLRWCVEELKKGYGRDR